jgi:hypothetical protein
VGRNARVCRNQEFEFENSAGVYANYTKYVDTVFVIKSLKGAPGRSVTNTLTSMLFKRSFIEVSPYTEVITGFSRFWHRIFFAF